MIYIIIYNIDSHISLIFSCEPRRALDGILDLRLMQDDVVRVNNINEEAKLRLEEMQLEIDRLKREHAEFKLKATRSIEEKQKVCPTAAAWA